MAYKPINPVVATVSPNIYNAVQNTPMSAQDQNTIEQLSFAYAKGLEFKKLDEKVATQKFQSLSKDAQADLRYIYPNEPWAQGQQSLLGKVVGGVFKAGVRAAQITISPLIAMYSGVEQYSKGINAPARVAFQATSQGKPAFSGKTWSTAYQGKDLYNPTDVDLLTKKYGPETAYVAMGIVAGKTPGEIFAGWKDGTPDDALFNAYSKFINDPTKMTSVIDETKLARFSPGRSVARNEISTNPNPIVHGLTALIFGKQLPTIRIQGESEAAYKKRQAADTAAYLKKVSGGVDAFYQMVIDPMTYASFGLNKLAMSTSRLAPLADKIASHIQFSDYATQRLRKAAQEGKWEETVADTFTRPQVKDLWDRTAGPAIKQLADAKTSAERSIALDNIRRNVPAYNDPDVLRSLVKSKVFNAEAAKNYFTNFENAHYLLAGRTDNTTWFRNGIATARNQRQLTQGIALAAESFFNPVVGVSSARKTVEDLEKAGSESWKILSTLGKQSDDLINPMVREIKQYDDEITKAQKLGFKLGNLARQTQGNGRIILGEDAWRTARAFYLRAATVFPSDVAKVVTDIFVHAPFDEQRNAVYQLYAASMYNRGAGGVVNGENFIRKSLSKIFNTDSGFGVTPDLEIGQEFAKAAGANVVRWENDVPKITNIGAIQPSQVTTAIAALNDQAINQFAAMVNKKNNIPALFDGFIQAKWLQNTTDYWSFLNLFPRLGARTTVDHATFFIAVAPKDDILRYISGGAKKTGDYLNMVTGSKDAVGPFENLFHKLLKRTGPENYLTAEKRAQIIDELLEKESKNLGRVVTVQELNHAMIRAEVAQRAHEIIFGSYDTPFVTKEMLQEKEALINLFKYEPNYLEAQVSSLTGRANMSGAFVEEAARKPIFTESVVDKALKDVNKRYAKELKKGKVKELQITSSWEPRTAKDLRNISGNDEWFAIAHLHDWTIRFVNNSVKVPTDRGELRFSPIDAFFNNNGIRDVRDFENATKYLMHVVGVSYRDIMDFTIEDGQRLSNFVRLWSGLYASMKTEGRSDVEIAETIIKTMLLDMRETFHGSTETTSFNEKLFDRIAEEYDKLVAARTSKNKFQDISGLWSKAAAKIEFPEFMKLTEGKRPEVLNTAINFPGGLNAQMNGVEGALGKYGYAAYEQMDRQVNAWFTQKALAVTYLRIYKANLPFKEGYTKQLEKTLKEANPSWPESFLKEKAKEQAEKRFTHIALNDASNTLLKYVDNQAIRSNFAVSFRTVGRYYRANEDFMRRVYRMMKDKPLRTLYRTRLLHTSVDAYGGTYQDENGKDYLIFPSDTIYNHAVSWFLNTLYGADPVYTIPQFSNFKMKLELINPSFSQDAGSLTLSSPAGTVAVLAAKGLIGIRSIFGRTIPFASEREKIGDDLAQIFLGTTGKSIALNSKSWAEAIMPMFMKNAYGAFDRSDANQQFASAAMSAAAYLQAYGNGLPSPQDPDYGKKMAEAQKNLRIAAGNILVYRFIQGMIVPASMSLQESKGLPNYMLAAGDVSLRGEFYKILQGIQDTYGTSIQDPYSLAVAIFTGENPGKSIYTISRSSKAYSVVVKNTQPMKDWALNNLNFVNTYPKSGAGWIFAPQSGKFNSTVYSWLQAQDLINIPKFEDYLQNVSLNEDRNAYFQIGKDEKEALSKTMDLTERKNIMAAASDARQSLLASNTLLQGALQGGINVRGDTMQAYKDIKSIVADNKTPINKKDRVVMRQAIAQMDSYLDVVGYGNAYSNLANYSEIKQQAEDRVDAELQKLINLSPAVAQAYNYVFKSIFTSYNPETATVIKRG